MVMAARRAGRGDDPGTFGWAQDATGNCSLSVRGAFPASAPPSVTAACRAVLQNAQQSQVPILVPVYVSQNREHVRAEGFR